MQGLQPLIRKEEYIYALSLTYSFAFWIAALGLSLNQLDLPLNQLLMETSDGEHEGTVRSFLQHFEVSLVRR